MYITRSITPKLLRSLTLNPMTLVTGPRQSGKTTLIKHVADSKGYNYITFDDIKYLANAKNDPHGFIMSLKKPIILDEIQRVPEVFLPIKYDIDLHREPGRYLVSGSANPLDLPNLGDSMAGRLQILKLYPLSAGELAGSVEQFIDAAFNGSIKELSYTPLSKPLLLSKLIIGGYPNIQNRTEEERDEWFESYLTALVMRDIKDYTTIQGITEFPKLLELIAARVGGLLNTAELSRSSDIAVTTLHRYMGLLKNFFITYPLLSWSANHSQRNVKSPKMYLIDCGLLSHLLGADDTHILSKPSFVGFLLENFVVSELLKQRTWSKTRTKLYHYRTKMGEEVDILLEDRSGKLVGIEIKSHESIDSQDFRGLIHLKKNYPELFIQGMVLYPGTERIPYGPDMCALPISSLWGTLT